VLLQRCALIDAGEALRAISLRTHEASSDSLRWPYFNLTYPDRYSRIVGRTPAVIDIPINKLRKMKVAVLLWSLQTTAQEKRAIETNLASSPRRNGIGTL
jgi:hypothetical protein